MLIAEEYSVVLRLRNSMSVIILFTLMASSQVIRSFFQVDLISW